MLGACWGHVGGRYDSEGLLVTASDRVARPRALEYFNRTWLCSHHMAHTPDITRASIRGIQG